MLATLSPAPSSARMNRGIVDTRHILARLKLIETEYGRIQAVRDTRLRVLGGAHNIMTER